MKNNIIVISILVMLASRLHPQEKKEDPAPYDPEYNVTVIFGFKPENRAPDITEIADKKFHEALGRIPYLHPLHPDGKFGEKGAFRTERERAIRIANELNAHMAVTGTIKKIEVEHTGKYRDGESYKYILEKEKTEYYILKVELIRLSDSMVLCVQTEKTTKKNLDSTIEKLSQNLAEHFKPRVKKNEAVSAPRAIPFSSLYGSSALPVSKFGIFSGAGFGFKLNAGLYDIPVNNSVLSLSLEFIEYSPKKWNLKKFRSIPIMLETGYRFGSSDKFKFSVHAGIGYHIHFTTESPPAGKKNFYDPAASLLCEAEYTMNDNWSAVIAPSHSFIFEKSAVLHCFGINIGIKYQLK